MIKDRKQKFIRFLKENNCYNYFMHDFNKYGEWDSIDKMVDYCNDKSCNEIFTAFAWYLTDNEYKWQMLSLKWSNYKKKLVSND